MKIAIVGPVNSMASYGGVALFTESIADGLSRQGHEVSIITDYSEKSETLLGTPIISARSKVARKNIRTIMSIRKKVNQLCPDVTISSLEYSIALLGKKPNKSMKRTHFIHGFPSLRYYGGVKLFVMLVLDRLYGRYFEYKFVNSNFSYMINNDIYKNEINRVINIGLGYDFLEKISIDKIIENNNNGKIVYIGRLNDAKKVDVLISALKYLKEKYRITYELDIVGDGPEESKLKRLALNYGLKVNFYGKVNTEETIKFYRNSELFVSLNPHEPFGMVYLEALANGCKIICPRSGGQLDFLTEYLDRVKLVNAFDPESVGEGIVELIGKKINPMESSEIIEKFSYDNVAKKIIDNITKE